MKNGLYKEFLRLKWGVLGSGVVICAPILLLFWTDNWGTGGYSVGQQLSWFIPTTVVIMATSVLVVFCFIRFIQVKNRWIALGCGALVGAIGGAVIGAEYIAIPNLITPLVTQDDIDWAVFGWIQLFSPAGAVALMISGAIGGLILNSRFYSPKGKRIDKPGKKFWIISAFAIILTGLLIPTVVLLIFISL
jgi:hypothetical protein